jgi:hypothetical protein
MHAGSKSAYFISIIGVLAIGCLRLANAQTAFATQSFYSTMTVTEGEPLITFHVTAVTKSDATDVCSQERHCSATRFTVAGYTVKSENSATEYVLDCVEIKQNPPNVRLLAYCSRIHASRDYEVVIDDDSVYFGGKRAKVSGSAPESAYSIVSEKEAKRSKEQ